MKKFSTLGVFLFCASMFLSAAPRTVDAARVLAATHFSSRSSSVSGKQHAPAAELRLAYTHPMSAAEANSPALYVFNNGDNGFVIVTDKVIKDKKGNHILDLNVLYTNTGEKLPSTSLSGGESFKASLALALGLSDAITANAGGINVDTMFIDEGFGSLDAQSRQQAIEVLGELAGDSRMVGIISHVTELKEQIDRKLVVSRTDKGSRAVWTE